MFCDDGYVGVDKHQDPQTIQSPWHAAISPGKQRSLDKSTPLGRLPDELERLKTRIRAKIEHPFRVIKCQFAYVKAQHRDLIKNTQQLFTLFALSDQLMM